MGKPCGLAQASPNNRVKRTPAYLLSDGFLSVEAEVLAVLDAVEAPVPFFSAGFSQPIANIPKLHNTNNAPSFFIATPFILWMAGTSARRRRTSLPLTIH
jgi:hypothetical protein